MIMDYSILVNKDHLLEENYVPETLVEIHETFSLSDNIKLY